MFRQVAGWAPALARCQDLLQRRPEVGAIGIPSSVVGEIRLSIGDSQRCREFVKPSTKSISDVALAMESKITDRLCGFAANAPGKESYPIVSFTWFYVPCIRRTCSEPCGQRIFKPVYASGNKSRKRKLRPAAAVGSAKGARESGRAALNWGDYLT